jgi:hypothetical protein
MICSDARLWTPPLELSSLLAVAAARLAERLRLPPDTNYVWHALSVIDSATS